MLTPDQRRRQLDLARAAAAEADRDPEALEYTRWGLDLTDPGTGRDAGRGGVTRLVVGGEEDDLTAFAERFDLRSDAQP